jgi:hypothetical protein
MSWVRRNAQGRIEAASDSAQPGYVEQVADNDPELVAFRTNTPWPPPVADAPTRDSYAALIDRRARALNRKGTTEARLQAINLKLGA